MPILSGSAVARTPNPLRSRTLAGATLVFYAGTGEGRAGSARWGFRSLDRLPEGAIGRAEIDADGRYSVELPLRDEMVTVAIEVERFLFAAPTGRRAVGVLGAGTPSQDKRGLLLDIELPSDSFCALLKALDLWLVAGRVTDCGKPAIPLVGGEVTAFDRDVTQDDTLGSDVTDATGSFEIWFPGSVHRRIPMLPPPFDSISPFELFPGPDLFFKVVKDGSTKLDEPPATGRTPGRENRKNCSYTELCVQAPSWTPQTVTLWSHIGNIHIPDGGGLHDMDADGFVASGKRAFWDSLDFNGQLSQTYLGEAVSFRFIWAEWPDLVTAPAAAAFQPATAAHIVASAPYGSIYTFLGPNPWDFTLTDVLPAPDAAGWIAVEQSPNFVRNTGRMIQLNSAALVPAIDVSGSPTGGAGDPVPVPQRDRPRKFSFKLQVKTASASYEQPTPVVVHLNNTPAFLRFDLQELEASGCSPVTPLGGQIIVHPKYTVAHPYLHSFSITLNRQGGAVATLRSDDFTAHSPLWTDADGEHATFAGAPYGDVGPCSYHTWMSCSRRLTNGVYGPGDTPQLRTFCID